MLASISRGCPEMHLKIVLRVDVFTVFVQRNSCFLRMLHETNLGELERMFLRIVPKLFY